MHSIRKNSFSNHSRPILSLDHREFIFNKAAKTKSILNKTTFITKNLLKLPKFTKNRLNQSEFRLFPLSNSVKLKLLD